MFQTLTVDLGSHILFQLLFVSMIIANWNINIIIVKRIKWSLLFYNVIFRINHKTQLIERKCFSINHNNFTNLNKSLLCCLDIYLLYTNEYKYYKIH